MTRPTYPSPPVDPPERRLRQSWWLFAGSFFVLGVLFLLRLTIAGTRTVDFVLAALVVIVGFAAILHRNAVHELQVGRRGEAESVARILQGLSRSVSPDAIVDAIVEELGVGTGADHIVVVRRRAETNSLEARLVSSRPGVPSSTTLFPLSDLDDAPAPSDDEQERALVAVPVAAGASEFDLTPSPVAVAVASWAAPRTAATAAAAAGVKAVATTIRTGAAIASALPARHRQAEPAARPVAARRAAERIANRAQSAYGLRNTLVEPLTTEAGVVGAIVLSRRRPGRWPSSARRILAGAALEASAALARATNHRDAETRASTDVLTGLPNRRYFDEFCGLLARRRRADDAVGVLLVDIDWFKSVNDTWGHAAGDSVLREVARAIVGAVREEDVPARFGGEEFVVLLRNPGQEVAVDVAERVRAAVGRLDLRRFGPAGVTVSVGVAVAQGTDQPVADIVDAADRALYQAKRSGRDRVVAAR